MKDKSKFRNIMQGVWASAFTVTVFALGYAFSVTGDAFILVAIGAITTVKFFVGVADASRIETLKDVTDASFDAMFKVIRDNVKTQEKQEDDGADKSE